MYSSQSEMLARARLAELSRPSNPRARSRSSLRIILDARRARQQSPAR